MGRPLLRPGLRAVRRDDTHLQLGLDDPDRLVLPDLPGLLDALRALPLVPRDERVRRVLDRLAGDGWIIDAAPVGPASLRRLRVSFVGFDGREDHVVVHRYVRRQDFYA